MGESRRTFRRDLKDLILETLRQEKGYLSGESLAQRLGISRQALWKHIVNLNSKGYEIVAVPHLGYRLLSSPDRLYPWEIQYKLNTTFVGKNIYYYQITESTQDIAKKLGLQAEEEGVVVVSESQKRGRGRLGRSWFSPLGGIYFSLLLRPDFIFVSEVPQIALLAAVGCVRAIKKVTNLLCSLKWPNDILIKGKKVGGILCELDAEADRIKFVVVGIGINVNISYHLPPYATSLSIEIKKRVCRVEILRVILEEIERLYLLLKNKGFFSIRQEWEEFSCLRGERVRVKVLNREIEGLASGIDEKGYLVLRSDTGSFEKISAGDVIRVKW